MSRWDWNQNSEDEFLAALNGESGDELQADAELFAEENGIEVEWVDNPEAAEGVTPDDDDTSARDAFFREVARLETHVGRKLTSAEIDRLVNAVPEQGALPDMVEKFGAELAGRTREKESRRAFMIEVAEDQRAKGMSEAGELDEPEVDDEPPEVDLQAETREQRRTRMVEAAEDAQEITESETPERSLTPAGHAIGTE